MQNSREPPKARAHSRCSLDCERREVLGRWATGEQLSLENQKRRKLIKPVRKTDAESTERGQKAPGKPRVRYSRLRDGLATPSARHPPWPAEPRSGADGPKEGTERRCAFVHKKWGKPEGKGERQMARCCRRGRLCNIWLCLSG